MIDFTCTLSVGLEFAQMGGSVLSSTFALLSGPYRGLHRKSCTRAKSLGILDILDYERGRSIGLYLFQYYLLDLATHICFGTYLSLIDRHV